MHLFPKIQDIGAKMLLYEILSHMYMSNHTSAVFVSNITSANVILFNKLILVNIVLYFKHNIVCFVQFCQRKHARNSLNDGLELRGLLVDIF